MGRSQIEVVRSFNRLVTERVGALNDQFLGRDRPIGESRLLWEIGPDTVEVRELRRRLALDSAYVSRMLRSLENQGLVVVEESCKDRRVRCVKLTDAGRAERVELDRLSDEFASSVLAPLSDSQKDRLTSAMTEVEQLLTASMVRIEAEDPTTEAANWCIQQYFAELNERFDAGFDPDLSISAEAHELTPPAGVLLIAWLRHDPVGCGVVKFHGAAPAELKRMWVAPTARGLGLGRRLLQELEICAWRGGASTVHLETNRTLTEAISLYRGSGYIEVPAFNDEPYAHHWFEKQL